MKYIKPFFLSCLAGLAIGILSQAITGEFLPGGWFLPMAIVQIIVYQLAQQGGINDKLD